MLWPVVVAAIILFTGLSPAEAGTGAEIWHPLSAAAPGHLTGAGHAQGQGEREGEANTGEHEAARSRTVARRLAASRDLGHVPAEHPSAAYHAPRLWDGARRTNVTPGPHARHSGRSPGARLLIALNISRT